MILSPNIIIYLERVTMPRYHTNLDWKGLSHAMYHARVQLQINQPRSSSPNTFKQGKERQMLSFLMMIPIIISGCI